MIYPSLGDERKGGRSSGEGEKGREGGKSGVPLYKVTNPNGLDLQPNIFI